MGYEPFRSGVTASTVADGGTIPHGLGVVPTFVCVHGTVAGQTVTATAVSSTVITLAIKAAGSATTAGTAQKVYWLVAR